MEASKIYRIEGGNKLEGSITVNGAKNAISKQLVASLLTEEPCTFTNVPMTTEVSVVLEMLEEVGTKYNWIDKNCLEMQTPKITHTTIGQKYSGFNRIPILMLGPLLHRAGEVTVPIVGGDALGTRPVDFHVSSLSTMGANVDFTDNHYSANSTGLKGTIINLPYPSVGATENIIIAATLATGTTTITNAAIEPEIMDTILFLQKMGALISTEADRRIIIEGVSKLKGTSHHTLPDRIETASFAVTAVTTNGKIYVQNARQDNLISFLNALRKVGGEFTVDRDGITFYRAKKQLKGIQIETDVFPGFATDWQPPFVTLLTQASEISIVHETVYEKRFGYTEELKKMGADISLNTNCLGSKPCRFLNQNHNHCCVIKGQTQLYGKNIRIPDLRAGFAYLVAALTAEGVSELSNVRYIERGYADIPQRLKGIGAAIEVMG